MVLLHYMLRIAPGMALFIALILLLPRGMKGLRVMAHIMLFILIRDAMTPLGFWSFGDGGGFWIRFVHNGPLLMALGLSSAALAGGIYLYERDMRGLIEWFRSGRIAGAAAGIGSAVVIAAPLLAMGLTVPLASRGGAFAPSLLPALLVVTLGGNLYEELLFRGYLQGYFLEKGIGPIRAALLSGIAFGAGHAFLASTVTSIGIPLLAFATWEGIVLGMLRMRFGVIPAALAHGLAIFLLASALI
ncbi:MAG: CPBP family intramembrane metalloprotease [Spirochaetes bacterium]|nr:CPBP family intramembrane metalloprotease [Spirochaetota bacterium]